jgi:hypothetical protein
VAGHGDQHVGRHTQHRRTADIRTGLRHPRNGDRARHHPIDAARARWSISSAVTSRPRQCQW